MLSSFIYIICREERNKLINRLHANRETGLNGTCHIAVYIPLLEGEEASIPGERFEEESGIPWAAFYKILQGRHSNSALKVWSGC